MRGRFEMYDNPDNVDGRVARWSGQRERRREEFVEAAIATIGLRGPDVSIDQITERLGISRTKLYRHFDGAADLQRAVAQRATEMIISELQPVWNPVGAPRVMIATAVSAYLGWITRHVNLYRYLERHSIGDDSAGEDAISYVKTSVGGRLAGLVAAYQKAFGVDESPAENLAFGVLGVVESATSRWLDHPAGVLEGELAERLGDWVWLLMDDTLRRGGVVLDRDSVLPAPDLIDASGREALR